MITHGQVAAAIHADPRDMIKQGWGERLRSEILHANISRGDTRANQIIGDLEILKISRSVASSTQTNHGVRQPGDSNAPPRAIRALVTYHDVLLKLNYELAMLSSLALGTDTDSAIYKITCVIDKKIKTFLSAQIDLPQSHVSNEFSLAQRVGGMPRRLRL